MIKMYVIYVPASEGLNITRIMHICNYIVPMFTSWTRFTFSGLNFLISICDTDIYLTSRYTYSF